MASTSPRTLTRTFGHQGGTADAAAPLTWPAAELDARWPQLDPGLAAWRYHRILETIKEREAQYQPACQRPCCSDTDRVPGREWEVLIAVPVRDGWRRAAGQTTIAAYECTGRLLSGEALERTVLAYFPLIALRQAIRRRLRELKHLRCPSPTQCAAQAAA